MNSGPVDAGTFTESACWSASEAGSTGGLITRGYEGAVFDGRYVYFSPGHDGVSAHGNVLRYDTGLSFTDLAAWQAFNAGNTSPLTDTKGYRGAIFDGRYVYFSPGHDGSSGHGKALRHDTPARVRTGLRLLGDRITLGWEAVCGAGSYNVYRGNLLDLRDEDDDGLPDAGYGICVSNLGDDTTDALFVDAEVPPAGAGFFYLMSYNDSTGEYGLGETSAGLPRNPVVHCE